MLKQNPYQPPRASSEQPTESWSVASVTSYLTTSVMIGSLAGTGLLFCYRLLIVSPPWEPVLYKGDERWETIFFLASTSLPVMTIIGILLATASLWLVSFRMNYREIMISCLGLWYLISGSRPIVSRLRGPKYPDPGFETIPDTMMLLVCVIFLITCVSAFVQYILKHTPITAGTVEE